MATAVGTSSWNNNTTAQWRHFDPSAEELAEKTKKAKDLTSLLTSNDADKELKTIDRLLLGDIALHVKKGEWKSLLMLIDNPLLVKLETVKDAAKASLDAAAEKAIELHIEKLVDRGCLDRKFHLKELGKIQDCKSEWLSDRVRNQVGEKLEGKGIDTDCQQTLLRRFFIGNFKPPVKGKRFGDHAGSPSGAKNGALRNSGQLAIH